MLDEYDSKERADAPAAAATMADYFEVNTKQLSVEFRPQIKYSIPADGKPHHVALQEFSIPAA